MKKYIYLSLLSITALIFSSCEREDSDVPDYDTDDSIVTFIPSFPAVGSRVAIEYKDADILYNNGDGFQVTAFKPEEAPSGTLKPWAEEFRVRRRYDACIATTAAVGPITAAPMKAG